MCGFYGAINRACYDVGGMSTLRHRGPDSEGLYEDARVYLKHYRLAILGEERYAHQPMTSRDGRYVMAYNGEIYNYREIAETIGEASLAAEGDTRVLIELISRYGTERLDLLNGMFAAAVYDKLEGSIILLRDRFGVKPLYYRTHGKALLFASEVKCLKGHIPASVDMDKVTEYLDMGVYPSGKMTFYREIKQVEPGTFLEFGADNTVREHRYFDLRKEVMDKSARKLTIEEYESLLDTSIKLRLRSDVPISLHYSGGTDSTALLFKTKEVWGWDYPLVAYTMSYREAEYDESAYTGKYCREISVENRKVFLEAHEVPELAGELSYYEDEPYGGIPVIAYYKMNKAEREANFIVSIEGQGGDEGFGGYLSHTIMAVYDLYLSGACLDLVKETAASAGLSVPDAVKKAEQLISSGFNAHMDLTDKRPRGKDGTVKFMDWLRTIQMRDILDNKIPRTLRFHDRASMAAGREVRFPLLDHNVLIYGVAFSHEMKYRSGLSKYPLRAIIKRYLKDAYSAPKRSVVTPQSFWLRGKLKSWAFERADALKGKNVIDKRYFDRFDSFYERDEWDNSFYLWQIINLSYFFGSA